MGGHIPLYIKTRFNKNKNNAVKKLGFKFTTVSSKTLRLYFESHYTEEITIEEEEYLKHIFEVKTYLYFNKHHNKKNLIDIEKFCKNCISKVIDSLPQFSEIKEINIIPARGLDPFFYENFTLNDKNNIYINEQLSVNTQLDINTVIAITDNFVQTLRYANCLRIFLRLNDNANLLYFVLSKIATTYCCNLNKLIISQVGLEHFNEEMFPIIAEYLLNASNINSIVIECKPYNEFHLYDEDENEEVEEDEEYDEDISIRDEINDENIEYNNVNNSSNNNINNKEDMYDNCNYNNNDLKEVQLQNRINTNNYITTLKSNFRNTNSIRNVNSTNYNININKYNDGLIINKDKLNRDNSLNQYKLNIQASKNRLVNIKSSKNLQKTEEEDKHDKILKKCSKNISSMNFDKISLNSNKDKRKFSVIKEHQRNNSVFNVNLGAIKSRKPSNPNAFRKVSLQVNSNFSNYLNFKYRNSKISKKFSSNNQKYINSYGNELNLNFDKLLKLSSKKNIQSLKNNINNITSNNKLKYIRNNIASITDENQIINECNIKESNNLSSLNINKIENTSKYNSNNIKNNYKKSIINKTASLRSLYDDETSRKSEVDTELSKSASEVNKYSEYQLKDFGDEPETRMNYKSLSNKLYLFLFYQALSLKHNLLELNLLCFIYDYSLVQIAQVIVNNSNLRIIKINNVLSSSDNNLNELEYTFNYYNKHIGDKIKDEIFILFNALNNPSLQNNNNSNSNNNNKDKKVFNDSKNLSLNQFKRYSDIENERTELIKNKNKLQRNIKKRDSSYLILNSNKNKNHLKYLHTLSLTRFWFNSDINYLACQTALINKSIIYLDLSKNQAILSNESIIEDSFNFANSNITHLYLGRTYFNMMRSWNLIINKDILFDFDAGILDYTSMMALIKYLPKTKINILKLTLNKSCDIGSLEFLFKSVSIYIFQSDYLRQFSFINAYSNITFKYHEKKIENYISTYIVEKFKMSDSLNEICFSDDSEFYTPFKDCMYIKPDDFDKCITLVILIKSLFWKDYSKIKYKISIILAKLLYANYKIIKY